MVPFNSNPSLDFVAAPALAPAEVQVDAALMEQYQKELQQVRVPFAHCLRLFSSQALFSAQAEAVPLPEEDDDL